MAVEAEGAADGVHPGVGWVLTKVVVLRQHRAPSHTDIAEVRPRLPEVCTPQEQRARRGSVKTPHPELVVAKQEVVGFLRQVQLLRRHC